MSKATVIATLVLLTIQRSSEVTITDSFFEHEVPILELIHGEENITILQEDYHEIELPNNATQEYQRLVTKYGEKYRPAVDQVFRGGARDIAKKLGMDVGKDSFKKQSEAMIISRLPPRPGEKEEQETSAFDEAVQKAAAALVAAAQPAPAAPSVTGPANPPASAAAAAGGVQVDDGSDELSRDELREELTKRGIEHKGNASKADLQQLLDDAKEVEAKGTLGG